MVLKVGCMSLSYCVILKTDVLLWEILPGWSGKWLMNMHDELWNMVYMNKWSKSQESQLFLKLQYECQAYKCSRSLFTCELPQAVHRGSPRLVCMDYAISQWAMVASLYLSYVSEAHINATEAYVGSMPENPQTIRTYTTHKAINTTLYFCLPVFDCFFLREIIPNRQYCYVSLKNNNKNEFVSRCYRCCNCAFLSFSLSSLMTLLWTPQLRRTLK